MKLFLNLIPALAYALVTFFSNMAGLTNEIAKSPEKKQIVSQPVQQQENVCRKDYIWNPNNLQNIASNEDVNASLAWKFPSPQTSISIHTSLVIKRYILSAYATN